MEPSHQMSHKLTMRDIEPLSEIIIDTLKTLANQQQQLSPGSLSAALRAREDFLHLLQGNGDGLTDPTDNQSAIKASKLHSSISSIQTDSRHHDPDSSSADYLTVDTLELAEFYKKSVLTLISLAQTTENKSLCDSLDNFRSVILDHKADLEALGTSLQRIKNTIMQEDPVLSAGGPKAEGTSFFRSLWQRRTKQAEDGDSSKEVNLHLQQLQSLFLTIANQLQLGLGDEYLQRFSELKQRFESSADIDTLLAHADDLIGIVQSYIKGAAQERNQVANFVKELGRNLLEMEGALLSSLTHSQEAYKLNSDFNDTLHGQLEDIKDSFSISRSLDEIRGFVISKLKTIKSALESKRMQDEESLQLANEKMGSLQQSFQEMKKEVGQIQQKTKILEQEVLLDSLTGIYNRRAYELRIKEELNRHSRYTQLFSLILFDIDHFKKVNDQYGHQAGDKCLREIARRIKPHLRQCDFLARYGGEEFIIILPSTTGDAAYAVAEKIRKLIEKTRFLYKGQEVPVTISLGLTEAKTTDQEPGVLFVRADAAMYEAKKGGRNRTHRV
jgi:diguanylate cyclase